MIMAQLNYNSKQLAAIFSCCENTITNYLNKLEKPDNDCSVLVDLPKHTYSISGQFIDKGIFRLGYLRWPGLSRRRIGLFKVNSGLLNGASVEWSERSERSGTGAPFNRVTQTTYAPEW